MSNAVSHRPSRFVDPVIANWWAAVPFTQWVTLLALCLVPCPLRAQEQELVSVADTSSPRDTLRSFINASNAIYAIVERERHLDARNPAHLRPVYTLLDCLDTRQLPAFARDQRAGEVAVCIKEIIDRVNLPPWEQIPDTDQIEAAGGYEGLPRWRIPGTRITIARVEEGPQKHEYLFSAGTVDRAVDYYFSQRFKPYREDGPATSPGFYKWFLSAPRTKMFATVIDRMPEWMRYGRSFGMANWKWPFLILAITAAIAVMAVAYWIYWTGSLAARQTNLFRYWLLLIFPVIAAMTPIAFDSFVEELLGARGSPLYISSFISVAVFNVATVVLLFAVVARVAETIIASPSINPQGLNAQLIRIVAKLVSTAAALGALLYGGQYLGIPVGTLLASAGIGGLAIALGAQDTLKDLFGTISLMADKPFRVGDRIILDKYDGVVEDIGLRSTRLRLLTGHVVTLPNDQLARSDVENVGRRTHIRRLADIHLPLETPRESIEKALEIIRNELADHEGMDPELPPRVYFAEYLPDAFKLRILYWYHPPNYWDYMAFSERVNLAIFRAFDSQGIKFSLPARMAHTSLGSDQRPVDVKIIDGSGSS